MNYSAWFYYKVSVVTYTRFNAESAGMFPFPYIKSHNTYALGEILKFCKFNYNYPFSNRDELISNNYCENLDQERISVPVCTNKYE